jgi:hypothetical protein
MNPQNKQKQIDEQKLTIQEQVIRIELENRPSLNMMQCKQSRKQLDGQASILEK